MPFIRLVGEEVLERAGLPTALLERLARRGVGRRLALVEPTGRQLPPQVSVREPVPPEQPARPGPRRGRMVPTPGRHAYDVVVEPLAAGHLDVDHPQRDVVVS